MQPSFPAQEGWLHCKVTYEKGQTLTEAELKRLLLCGKCESKYEFGYVKTFKRSGRVVFRKKTQNAKP